jgi:hypothetical protein
MSDLPDPPTLEAKERMADQMERENRIMERENRLMKAEMGEAEKAVELVLALGSRSVAKWTRAEILEVARFLALQQGRQEPGLLALDNEIHRLQGSRFRMARLLAKRLSESPTAPGRPKKIKSEQIVFFQTLMEGSREHREGPAAVARRMYRMKKIRGLMAKHLGLDPNLKSEASFVKRFVNVWRSVRRAMKENR